MRIQTIISYRPGLPGLPGSIRRLGCHGWPSAGEKSLKLKNTPSHSPNVGQASPCHASYSTHTPILIACSILCLALPHTSSYMHHNPSISDLSFSSWKPRYMLFLELFDTVLHSFIHHSKALTHNLTPPFCINYPLTSPSFPLYLNSTPNHKNSIPIPNSQFIPSYIHSFGNPPFSQAEGS